jgi:hypothetical protein
VIEEPSPAPETNGEQQLTAAQAVVADYRRATSDYNTVAGELAEAERARSDSDELGKVIAALVSRPAIEWVTNYDADAVSPEWAVNLKMIDGVRTYINQLRDAWITRGLA